MRVPRLSILIPVYNGARHLDVLLRAFASWANERFTAEAEIVVVNNTSADDTLSVARRYEAAIRNLRVIDADVHVPTAEQNVFRSFRECRGEYVWTLGVDDRPILSSVERLLTILGQYDFMVFNNPVINEEGVVTAQEQIRMTNEIAELPIVTFAEEDGMWFTLAGMSGHVLRRALVENFDLDTVIRQSSVIYSHVIAYLQVFRDKRFALINIPLVYYRVTYMNTAHWKKAARLIGVCEQYFWTVGFLRQLWYLERHGIIDQDFINRLRDHNEFHKFRPLDILLIKTYLQVRSGVGFSPEDMTFLCDFLTKRSPHARELALLLKDANSARFPPGALMKARRYFYCNVMHGKPWKLTIRTPLFLAAFTTRWLFMSLQACTIGFRAFSGPSSTGIGRSKGFLRSSD